MSVVNDNVRGALATLIQSGGWSNPALSALVRDYTLYHLILVLSASTVAVVCVVLSLLFTRRWRRARDAAYPGWRFARRAYLGFALFGAGLALLLVLLAATDLSNVLDARHGFTLAVDSLKTPGPRSPLVPLYVSFTSWVESGSPTIPVQVQQSVQARVDFQRTNTIVSTLLLALSLAISVVLWRVLLDRSRVRPITWHLRDSALLVPAVTGLLVALPLLAIVLANLQSALAPLAKTLAFG